MRPYFSPMQYYLTPTTNCVLTYRHTCRLPRTNYRLLHDKLQVGNFSHGGNPISFDAGHFFGYLCSHLPDRWGIIECSKNNQRLLMGDIMREDVPNGELSAFFTSTFIKSTQHLPIIIWASPSPLFSNLVVVIFFNYQSYFAFSPLFPDMQRSQWKYLRDISAL